MRTVAILLLGLAVGGCAAAAKQLYQSPTDVNAEQWLIEGRESGFGKISITINGESVIDGKISIWSGAGEFVGKYQGKTIAAACAKAQGAGMRTRCTLFVNGEKATTIYFKVL